MAGRQRPNPRGLNSPGGLPQPHMQLGQQGKGAGRVRPNQVQPSGLQAVRQMYGGYWKPEAGAGTPTLRLNEQNATQMMNGIFTKPTTQAGDVNPNYRPAGSLEGSSTPFMNPQGNRMGFFQGQGPGQPGEFQLVGGGQGGGAIRPTGQGGPGGGGRPNPRGNQSQGGMPGQVGRPGGGMQGGMQNGGQRGMPEIGGYPKFGQNPPPDFLPNTPGWEAARAGASGDLLSAETGYNTGNQLIGSTLGLQNARLDTDRQIASDRLDEQLAGRGLITSGLRAKAQQEQVATPFGRQYQDLGLGAAGQYADLASQYGGANLGYNQDLFNSLYQRANDAYSAQPLGMAVGQYQAPNMPMFNPTYPAKNRPRKNKKKAGGRK